MAYAGDPVQSWRSLKKAGWRLREGRERRRAAGFEGRGRATSRGMEAASRSRKSQGSGFLARASRGCTALPITLILWKLAKPEFSCSKVVSLLRATFDVPGYSSYGKLMQVR